MILFAPEALWALIIIKFYTHHQSLAINERIIGAWWKYLKRLLLSYKPWMLFIMSIVVLIRMPEAYAINVTVKSTLMSMTSYNTAAVIVPTANIVNSMMKGKKPILIPDNEVITLENAEDYTDEDSIEDYDEILKKEIASGEFFFVQFLFYFFLANKLYVMLQ